jgi:aromatic-L-amino-acid/L-tryptophan decarboxylase
MRQLVQLAMDRIVAHIESLPHQPAADTEGGAEIAKSVIEPMPESGTAFEDLLSLLFDRLVPKGFNTAGPGYLAYIPGGGIFHAAVADLLSDAFNRYVGVWQASPALSQLESNVIRWFSDIVGYPSSARGLLTTGGSMANLTAIVTARRNRLPENFLTGRIYTSDQVHHSVVKAAILAGFSEKNVVAIPTDQSFKLDTGPLASAVTRDVEAGLTPFLVVASAGTTNTGAVDELAAIASFCEQQKLWFHVDGAYGGFFLLTERGRRVMHGIERADSITLDPHKALFLPYGTGCLLVRDGEALRRAHEVHASYMPPMQEDRDFVDFCLYSLELSRDFRGLRVWLPFKMHGIGPFRDNLDEKLDLAAWACEQLRAMSGIEIVAPPELSLVAFRYVRPGLGTEELNRLNEELLLRINRRQRVHLTATTIRSKFILRICVLSFRTHRDRVAACLRDISESIHELETGTF